MKNNIKLLGLGLLGGMLPLGAYLMLTTSPYQSLSDEVLDGNRLYNARAVSFDGQNLAPNFIDASETTINSVVHVTTKVVKTTFQRDPFQEFFYGPGAGGREFKQFGAVVQALLYLLKDISLQTTM